MTAIRVKSVLLAAGTEIKQADRGYSVLGSLQKQILQCEPEAGKHGAAVEIISDLENSYAGRGVVQVNFAGTRINDPDLTYARAKVILDLLGHLFRGVGQADDFDREIGNDFPGLGSWNAASQRPTLGRDKGEVGPALEAETGIQQKKGLGHNAPQLILIGMISHPAQQKGGEKGLKDTHYWLLQHLPANDLVESEPMRFRG